MKLSKHEIAFLVLLGLVEMLIPLLLLAAGFYFFSSLAKAL